RPQSARSANMGERPVRVQLSRKKGWRMPANTVVVARPSKWGNRHDHRIVGRAVAVRLYARDLGPGGSGIGPISAILTADDVRRELRGKNLACWCPLDQPCHADVLLELANKEPTDGR